MGENSKIEWTTHTFNPWRGCTKVSPGCTHCYAETLSRRNPAVLGVWGDRGTRVVASEAKWREVLAWDRAAEAAGERHRVFCASLADVFEDRPELVAPRVRLFHLIRDTPHLDWLLLTKRPENVRPLLSRLHADGEADGITAWECLPAYDNLWAGVSVEDRKHGLPRVDLLRSIPAAVRFLSVEPLLEDLGPLDLAGIDWVIVGGESGPGARPLHPDWARSIRDQCAEQGVSYFFKQWGEWAPDGQSTPFLSDVIGGRGAHVARALFPDGHHLPDLTGRGTNGAEATVIRRVGKKAAGRTLDGRTWDEFPGVAKGVA